MHFSNVEEQVPQGQDGCNTLFKIQPLFDIVNPTCEPERDLSLDESMVKFKGRNFSGSIYQPSPQDGA